MNKIKALYLPFYMTAELLLFALAIWKLATGANVVWASALIAALPSVALIVQARFGLGGDKQHHLPIHGLVSAAGSIAAVYQTVTVPGTSYAPALAAIAATTGFALFAYWWSSNGRRVSERLVLGERLPRIDAEDESGKPVSSDELVGNPALIMFYRGNWCPVCTSQVNDIVARYQQLADKGVRIVMISPQPHELTRRVAQTFKLPIDFWVDVENRAAGELGIVHEEGVPVGHRGTYGANTVLPTTIITDKDSRIIFTDQTRNYRVRPRPEDFLRALKAYGI